MKQVQNQKGATAISMMMLVGIIGFVAYFGFMLYGPFYDDLSVETVVNNLASDEKAKGLSTKKVNRLIQKRLAVNQVRMDPKYIVLEKTKEGVAVTIEYETRVNFISNIDLVARFSHSTVIPK
ncbi:MAG: hypothetical protein COA99_07110 [Moraxellaceae bacterium]|nr:MAG: hypothetical protein COA99_07110 [Moraxellaceae bacterium]